MITLIITRLLAVGYGEASQMDLQKEDNCETLKKIILNIIGSIEKKPASNVLKAIHSLDGCQIELIYTEEFRQIFR